MLETAHLVAFVACSDLNEAARFYGDTLGLKLIDASEFANVYDVNGTQLRVTVVDRPAQPGYTVLGWRVKEIAATMAALRAAGIDFIRYEGMTQDDENVWTAPGGSRIAWFADPDGNIISLQQAPAS